MSRLDTAAVVMLDGEQIGIIQHPDYDTNYNYIAYLEGFEGGWVAKGKTIEECHANALRYYHEHHTAIQ